MVIGLIIVILTALCFGCCCPDKCSMCCPRLKKTKSLMVNDMNEDEDNEAPKIPSRNERHPFL